MGTRAEPKTRLNAPLPVYIKIVCGLVQAWFLAMGLRDVLCAGSPLPVPNDDLLQLFFDRTLGSGSPNMWTTGGFASAWGGMVISLSALKIVAVFSSSRGCVLRRNLLLALGLSNVLMAILYLRMEPMAQAHGVAIVGKSLTFYPFVEKLLLEGFFYITDSVVRVGFSHDTPADSAAQDEAPLVVHTFHNERSFLKLCEKAHLTEAGVSQLARTLQVDGVDLRLADANKKSS